MMETLKISSLAQALNWLNGKPIDWAMIAFSRLALRALPTMVSTDHQWLKFYAVSVFRANLVAWASLNEQAFEFKNSISGAEVALQEALRRAYDDNLAWDAVASAMNAMRSVGQENDTQLIDWTESENILRFMEIHNTLFDDSSIQSDFVWIIENQTMQASADMTGLNLWLGPVPSVWEELPSRLKRKLIEADPNYSVWIDWYERRIRGAREAFDIPGDKGRVEDKKILRRLAQATDEDFWGKGHEYVNEELTRWLDEAQERAAKNLPSTATTTSVTLDAMSLPIEGDLTPLPPQNRNVLSFKPSPDGRIAIDATALADQLRSDEGAQERYLEAVCEAKAALNRCQGSNSGARLTRLLDNYLAATGNSLDDAKPSLIVQRGERLRQELASYEKPDSLLDPLADDLLNDLKGWLSAHNMMVGLDPVFNAADVAMLGPDRQPALIPPSEIREKVEQAVKADLLDGGVAEAVIEATILAPEVPEATDRRTLWSIEVARNLVIEFFAIALNPSNEEAQAAVHISVTGVRAMCGSLEHAKYIVNNREWIVQRLGSTPTLKVLTERLADRLEKITAFKPA